MLPSKTDSNRSDVKIEMHCHTVHSDGILSVAELLQRASDVGATHIAITDHDDVRAYPEAMQWVEDKVNEPDTKPPVVIPAVELSTKMDNRDVHMLGYFIDVQNEDLLREMKICKDDRSNRTKLMIKNLEADGYPISVEEFEKQNLGFNRSNIARVLFSAGVTSTVDGAFETLVGRGKPYYLPRNDMDSLLAVDLILGAGGVPVIAHPAHYGVVDLIDPLQERGLMGVECYHSEQTMEDSRMLVKLARDKGLIVTGGSDYHGDSMHPSVLCGNQPPYDDIEVFFELGRQRGIEL